MEADKKEKDEKAIISDRQVSNQELAELPISDVQTIDVNDGKPQFTTAELSLENGAWEQYGDLDQFNRPTYAEAMLNQSQMPASDRESLHVNPTGWRNKKIKSGYLYNRSHLIGFQFTGQNNNLKNLITGTRELNSPEMLRFEMDVAHYLKQSADNYVRYSVIPVFRGDELVARGVHMQAQSIDSDGISFNVFIANTQHGVDINYQDGTSQVLPEQEITNKTSTENETYHEVKEDAATQSNAPPTEETTPIVEEQVTEVPVPEDNTGQTVYITATGKKYHLNSNCRGLNNANGTTETTLANAQSMGLDKCGFE
ncbi:DNA/RNA non-specific endonuclease [Vagococcus intermedius]|uniref:DNA/RNA non-specific endonuclease n=1 Tax=Vagococcus intermedius TaxID=2991418 RepID=A0AAF0CWU3_9ENTE|nr:DNA/RNA non-specific endonuclease [Vagococcus intermedius]WEG76428.1 DNA/RNA non-specific endonuclease [Vagococcus intermedius]